MKGAFRKGRETARDRGREREVIGCFPGTRMHRLNESGAMRGGLRRLNEEETGT